MHGDMGIAMRGRETRGRSANLEWLFFVGALGAVVIFIVLVVVLFIAAMMSSVSHGREQFPGQHAQGDPGTREWFRNQISPSGYNCCSEADGSYVEEDIRKGVYWARWDLSVEKSPETNGWIAVPDAVVIKTPNRVGRPVVWWYFEQNGSDALPTLKVRCYAPGPLL
jgi:hypothetical protein